MSRAPRPVLTTLTNAEGEAFGTPPNPVVVAAGRGSSVTATIANAASVTGDIFVDRRLVAIHLPAAWTPAAITFDGSIDGGATFKPVFDIVGGAATERTISAANVAALADRMLTQNLGDWLGFTHIRIRSGTAAAPVAQGAPRAFVLSLAG